MLESMFKVLLKIIKNKKFTKFAAIVSLLVMSFLVCSSETSLVQTIVYVMNMTFMKLFMVFIATFLLAINVQLGLLFVMFVVVVINIPLVKTEHFSSIPNMVDKGSILRYNKNFKEPKELKSDSEKKEVKKKIEENKKEEKNDQEKEKEHKKRKKGFTVSEDYYHEKRGVNKVFFWHLIG